MFLGQFNISLDEQCNVSNDLFRINRPSACLLICYLLLTVLICLGILERLIVHYLLAEFCNVNT